MHGPHLGAFDEHGHDVVVQRLVALALLLEDACPPHPRLEMDRVQLKNKCVVVLLHERLDRASTGAG